MNVLSCISLTLALLAGALPLSAQNGCNGLRYRFPVFNSVTVTSNIQYGTGRRNWKLESGCSSATQGALPPYTAMLPLRADLYRPAGDALTSRPLIIFIHGGYFATGDKTDADAVYYCQQFARRGYVAASISYRLSLCGGNEAALAGQLNSGDYESVRAAFRALQDAKAAIRFFRANGQTWGIDTSLIFVAGISAGGITALGAAAIRTYDERYEYACAFPTLGLYGGNLLYPDLGPVEGEGGNPGYSSKVKAAASLAGGMLELDGLDAGIDPPLMLIHGSADDVIPPGAGCAFQGFLSQGLLAQCVELYGSQRIHTYADSIGLENEFLSFPGGGHVATAAQHDTAISRFSQFFYACICTAAAPQTGGLLPAPAVPAVALPRICPNPADAAAYVELPEDLPLPAVLTLYGTDGRRCWEYRITAPGPSAALPGGLTPGLYHAELRAGDFRWRSAWIRR
ncbi:MAG: alpha/beta hydrolase [Bacteroidia bacterium]|nr:alpha/beta hydrolase [Bacteroidia bacterium]